MQAEQLAAALGGRRLPPLILQAERSECALACIAMVLGHHGRRASLSELRRQHRIGLHGATLADLMTIAGAQGLLCRAVRLEPGELKALRLPAVLHWDLDHFVVLHAVRRGGVTLLDPAVGRRSLPWRQLDAHLSGIAVEMTPGNGFERRRRTERMHLTDFWSRSSGWVGALLQLLVLSLVLQGLALAAPLHVQLVVDEALVRRDAQLLDVLLLGFGVLLLVRVGVAWLRGRLVLHAGETMAFHMQSHLLDHLLRLPLGFFRGRPLGDVLSRLGSLAPVQALLTEGMAVAVVDGIMAITTLAMMLLYSPTLTALVVVALCVYALMRLASLAALRRGQQAEIAAGAAEETVLLETLRAMPTLKAMGREAQRLQLWQNRHVETINARAALTRFGLNLDLGNGLLFGLQQLVVVYAGAMAVLAGSMTVGMLYAFVSFAGQFTDRMSTLLDRGAELAVLRLHLERLADIGHAEPELDAQAAPRLPRGRAAVALRGASFGFDAQATPLFQDLDLTVPAGGLLVIHGPSGVGKSTLLQLLCGLLPPQPGELVVDGVPVARASLGAWRRRIGVVLQDDRLFQGSLMENVCGFDTAPDVSRLDACAREVGIEATVSALPMGWHTHLGEAGEGLSGGQRQRLLLARALYGSPDALFVDEVTAHLDAPSAELIVATLAQLRITRVVVTHRPGQFETIEGVRFVKVTAGRCGSVAELQAVSC